ncbi:MAG: site-2 protease family protein [Deltaproteobacteria bacterium]|nr:site-2 protease family protein [Deltaproteobacteria bacterium]
MTTILAFLLVFTIVVIVHEAGHFMAARLFSVKAYEFSIGFPFSPRIATLFRHRETEFTLRLLPLGGFVSFSPDGEDGVPEYFSLGKWKRAGVAAAGSAFNIIFSLFVFTAAFAIGKDMGLLEGAVTGLNEARSVFAGTFHLLSGLITGSGSFEGLSGPIGIAVMAGKAAGAGPFSLLYFTAMLSLSLGILNLLPLPALDGGHFVMIAVEAFLKRPLKLKTYSIMGVAGFVLFIVITAAVSYRDVLMLLA